MAVRGLTAQVMWKIEKSIAAADKYHAVGMHQSV